MARSKRYPKKFACAINCMDGRVQDAVKNYMKENYGVDYVDMITEPGPNKILADNSNKEKRERLIKEVTYFFWQAKKSFINLRLK